MRIVLTESQYKTLTRRLDDFVLIDRQFKLFLRKNSPCERNRYGKLNYPTFDRYFSRVGYKTEDDVVSKMVDKKILKFDGENDLGLFKKVREEIRKYIDDNLKEYTEEYYSQYKEKNCLNR